MYLDRLGFPVQADGDTGDVAHRIGWTWYGIDLLRAKPWKWLFRSPAPEYSGLISFENAMELLEPNKDGMLVRHPDRMDFADFSRDQQTAIIIELGRRGMKQVLWRVFKAHLKRWFRYQNKDVGFLEIGCLYIRAFRAWYLWPFLFLFDLNLVGNSVIKTGIIPIYREDRKVWEFPNDDDVDDLNHLMMVEEGLTVLPTLTGLLGALIYRYFRPKNKGNTILGEKSPIMGAIRWYFRPESRGNPEMAELQRPIVRALLDRRA